MPGVTLQESAVLLAALAIAAPLARWLGIGSVLGYLVAGMLLGPSTIGLGVLRLRGQGDPQLRRVRHRAAAVRDRAGAAPQASVGDAQRRVRARQRASGRDRSRPGACRAGCWACNGRPPSSWGCALALSSTAFALQVMEETGDLTGAPRSPRLCRAAVPGSLGYPAHRAGAAVRRRSASRPRRRWICSPASKASASSRPSSSAATTCSTISCASSRWRA